MNVKINLDDLDKEIADQLKEYVNTDVRRAANEGVKETAAQAVNLLKQGGPYKDRTGKYTKDWTYDIRRSKKASITGLDEYSVYNKKYYRLTHLLEKGHQLRKGGRVVGKVKSFEHIAPTEELVEQLVISNVEKKVREIS